MKNPFADSDREIDYGLKGRDIDISLKKVRSQNSPLVTPTLADLIDAKPALDGEQKNRQEWFELYEKQEGAFKGKRMICASDIYNTGKSKSKELCASLRKDFNDSVILSGTRNFYNEDTRAGTIVHNFNSTVAKPIELAVAEILVYQSTPVKDVVKGKGLAYAQALFNTKDNASKIIDTLVTLTQKDAKNIRFWTPVRSLRKGNRESFVGFNCDKVRLHIDGWNTFSYGRSRGVLLK